MLRVGLTVPERGGDDIDRTLVFIEYVGELHIMSPNGSNVRRVSREKMPRFGSHWKYLFPETHPSFLPLASSSTMPAQSPGAKCVSPMKAIWPGRWPPTYTRWPIINWSVSVVNTTPWSAMHHNQRTEKYLLKKFESFFFFLLKTGWISLIRDLVGYFL